MYIGSLTIIDYYEKKAKWIKVADLQKTISNDYTNRWFFYTARLSGTDPDDEELEEVEELERLTSLKDQSLWTKLKKVVLDLVERVGFFGILVCASVSNIYWSTFRVVFI